MSAGVPWEGLTRDDLKATTPSNQAQLVALVTGISGGDPAAGTWLRTELRGPVRKLAVGWSDSILNKFSAVATVSPDDLEQEIWMFVLLGELPRRTDPDSPLLRRTWQRTPLERWLSTPYKSLAGFVVVSARNFLRGAYRSARRAWRPSTHLGEARTPDDRGGEERTLTLEECLEIAREGLTDVQRQAIAALGRGLSIAEIAAELGVTPENVTNYLHRGKVKLKTYLSKTFPELFEGAPTLTSLPSAAIALAKRTREEEDDR